MATKKKPVTIEYFVEKFASEPTVCADKLVLKAYVKPQIHGRKLYIKPNEQLVISTGLRLYVPETHGVFIETAQSQLVQGVTVVSDGIRPTDDLIFSVVVYNHSAHLREIKNGDDLAYMYVMPITPIDATSIPEQK